MKKQKSLPKSEFTRSKMKSVGSKGIKARDLKETDEETTELMRDFMNVITKQGSATPSSWKKVMVKVLYKQKRSDETRKRPNILYLADVVHMFSTMLYNTAQQARQLPIFLTFVGFEKFRRRTILWRADSLFEKAGNVNRHLQRSTFKSRLTRYGTKPLYQWATHLCSEKFACWPTRHFADGRGEWWIRGCSRHETRRSFQQLSAQFGSPVINGDRHGDLEGEELWHQIGRRKKACISNLRFVDAVPLLASSWNQLKKTKKMHGSARVRNPPNKTEILTSQESDTQKEVDIDEIQVAILPSSWRKKPRIWDSWFH